ncbi:hypothetical protein M885DRAFT_542010 [Pelagophyceae sp. CCMP2097]|nr:hypothetical protein M885DRAFT_542010 [Pelagophyceae sp. CCMP2097]
MTEPSRRGQSRGARGAPHRPRRARLRFRRRGVRHIAGRARGRVRRGARTAAAARAAAATAAQQAAADAAAAARMSADIRAALIRGVHGAHSRGAPVVEPRHAHDPPQAAQGIDVAQLAPPLLRAPSKLPPFALCDLVRDIEQGGKNVDVFYGPLVGCIEDGKRLKPGLLNLSDAKKFEHRMVQYIAIRYYQHSFVTPVTGKMLLDSGRAAKKADARFRKATWCAFTAQVALAAQQGHPIVYANNAV